MDEIAYSENPRLSDDELNALFAESGSTHARLPMQPVLARSLVYYAARQGERLVGYVNVATDGGVHAFLLDPTVLPEFRNRGIGRELVRLAIQGSAQRGMEWVHVDFDEKHDLFYRRAGFQPTLAGLVRLGPGIPLPWERPVEVEPEALAESPALSPPPAPPPAPPLAPPLAPPPVVAPSVPSPFTRLRATGILVQSFFGAVVVVAIGMIVLGFKPEPGKADPAIFALFYLGIGLVLMMRIRGAHLDAGKLFGPAPSAHTLKLAIVALPLGMLSIAGFWILFLPLSFAAPNFVRGWALDSANRQAIQTLPVWSSQFLVAVVIAPVVEEVLFRGILMQRWALRWGTQVGVAASSVLFALGHVELLGHFVFGVVMCALYLRTRSLYVPIATHALNNFLASIGGLSEVLKPTGPEKEMTLALLRSNWWVGALLLVGALALLELYRRSFWKGVNLRALLNGPVPYDVV